MVLTTILLVLISSEVMFAPIFGAKILFLPVNIDSHILYFSRLAADLTQLGHVTRVLAPSNARVPQFIRKLESGGNFSYTMYQVDGEEPYANSRNMSAAIMRMALSRTLWKKFTVLRRFISIFDDHCEADCVRLLDNDHIMKQVRDEGYQFAVMDPFVTQCYYAIPYSLGVPYASMWMPAFTWLYRVPRLPSFVPSLGFRFTDRMSFVQRLTTFLVELLIYVQLQNKTTTYVDRLAPDRPSLNAIQLMQRVQFKTFIYSLYIFNIIHNLMRNVLLRDFNVLHCFCLFLLYSFSTFYSEVTFILQVLIEHTAESHFQNQTHKSQRF